MKTVFFMLVLAAIATVSAPAFARGGGGGHSGSHSGFHSSSHSSEYSSGSGHVNSHDHVVSSYTRKDGTHVESYHATNPNSTRNDNFSTQGNTNPYTGKAGTKPGGY